MKILVLAAILTLFACSSKIPSDIKSMKGKPVGGLASITEKYCAFETTSSSNAYFNYLYFPCKDFTMAVNKRTGIVQDVFAGKK